MEANNLLYQHEMNPYQSPPSRGEGLLATSQPSAHSTPMSSSGQFQSENPVLSHSGNRDAKSSQQFGAMDEDEYPPQQEYNNGNAYRSQQSILNTSFNGGNGRANTNRERSSGNNLYSSQFPKSEDLSRGLNDWRNIQHVVRLTFKSVCETIDNLSLQVRQQQEYIKRLEVTLSDQDRLLKDRVTRSEVSMEISRAMRDVHKLMETMSSRGDVATLLEKKADREEIEAKLKTKANAADFKKLVDLKADASDVNTMFDIHARDIDALKNQVKTKSNSYEVAEELSKKANIRDVQEALATKASIDDVHESLKAKIDSKKVYRDLALKADKSALESELQLKANAYDVNKWLMGKADVNAMNGSLLDKLDKNEFYEQMDLKFTEVRRQMDNSRDDAEERTNNSIRSITMKATQERNERIEECMNQLQTAKRELTSGLKAKASVKQVSDLLKTKANLEDMHSKLALKANVEDVRDALTSKLDVDTFEQLKTTMDKKSDMAEVCDMLEAKVDKEEYAKLSKTVDRKASKDSVVQALRKKVNTKDLKSEFGNIFDMDHIQRELALKVNVKDLIPLLEEKASVRDLYQETEQLQSQLQKHIDIDEYQKAWQDQSVINEALLSQNTVARWIWKSGKLKSGHGVPWNVQVVNTNPENFVWEKDRVNVITVQPGLYEVCFGFYGKKKPTIQFHVNGEAVLSAVNSSSYVVHHSNGRAASIANHSAGSVTGLTLVDFIALPERARVAISYSGDEKAEGFMSLRKL